MFPALKNFNKFVMSNKITDSFCKVFVMKRKVMLPIKCFGEACVPPETVDLPFILEILIFM